VSGLTRGRVYDVIVEGTRMGPELSIGVSLTEPYTAATEEKYRTLLRSRFVMTPGETVVAGTSRLDSGEALVAILTALTPSALK